MLYILVCVFENQTFSSLQVRAFFIFIICSISSFSLKIKHKERCFSLTKKVVSIYAVRGRSRYMEYTRGLVGVLVNIPSHSHLTISLARCNVKTSSFCCVCIKYFHPAFFEIHSNRCLISEMCDCVGGTLSQQLLHEGLPVCMDSSQSAGILQHGVSLSEVKEAIVVRAHACYFRSKQTGTFILKQSAPASS